MAHGQQTSGVSSRRKTMSIYVPVGDHRLIEHEAARRRTSMNRLLTEWIGPRVKELQQSARGES